MQYPVTRLLMLGFGVMFLITFVQELMGTGLVSAVLGGSKATLAQLGGMDRELVYRGEFWRLATAALLHANALHLVLNAWALWILGGLCEQIFGSIFTGVIFWASAIMGAVLSCSMGTELSVGSSGGVFGCLFALSALGLRDYRYIPSAVRRDVKWLTLFGMLNLALGWLIPMIDNAAHLGGTLMGFALGLCGPKLEELEWEKQ